MPTIEKLQLEVSIDHQFIEDILVTALEGGSNFWIDSIKINHHDVKKPRGVPTSIWASQALLADGTIEIFTDDEHHTLTKEKLIAGIKAWISSDPKRMEVHDGVLCADNIDADDADTITQYALFGKLVFG